MTPFEIPTVMTARLTFRAFRAGALDADVAMQANPEVMRHPLAGSAAECDAF